MPDRHDTPIDPATGGALWRLFVAVFPDEAALDAMAPMDRWLNRINSHRIIPRAQRHLTLAFVGDIDPLRLPSLQSTLTQTADRFSPFQTPFSGVTAFPSLRTPRVIAVAVDRTETLGAFMRSSLQSVARIAPTDTVLRDLDRDLQPHITTARTRRSSRARMIDLNSAPTLSGSLLVRRISLVRSQLSPTGPVYQSIAEIPLQNLASRQING